MTLGQVFGLCGSAGAVLYTGYKLARHGAGHYVFLRLVLAGLMLLASASVGYFVLFQDDAPKGLLLGMALTGIGWAGANWLLVLLGQGHQEDKPLDERLMPFLFACCSLVYFITRL